MSHGTRLEKTQHCDQGRVAASRPGLPPLESLRGTLSTGRQVTAGCSGATWSERHQERRYQPCAKGDGDSWMVEPIQSRRSRSGATAVRAAVANPARLADGLQSLRLHAVPAGLRPGEAGRKARMLSDHGLHAAGVAWKTTSRISAGHLEACQKNANGSPATGRSNGSSSRHGTRHQFQCIEIGDFVPPRDKTPCLLGWLRPATGHLYRFTICRAVFSEGSKP